MKTLTIGPRYGRDYNSAKEAKADFEANKDFTSFGLNSYGQAVNKADCLTFGVESVKLRFKALTQAVNIEVKA